MQQRCLIGSVGAVPVTATLAGIVMLVERWMWHARLMQRYQRLLCGLSAPSLCSLQATHKIQHPRIGCTLHHFIDSNWMVSGPLAQCGFL